MTPSEVLTKLLKDKVQREHLCIGDTSTDTSAPASVVVIPSKQCWLCGQDTSLRFRLKDLTSLCFRCFRTAYMALVLPRINSPARRQSDERFLDLIQHAQTDEREEAAGSSKAAVADAELDCSTPSPTSFILAAPPASQPSSTSALGRWVCSKCSLINKVCVQRCEACSAINDSQVFCGLCRRQCRVVGECGEKCTGEVPHVVWRCMGCYVLNTCDGDACINCRMEREWNCVHCSAKHSTKRIDGLRFCSTCRYDNTPDEVVVGQDNFFREQRQQPGNSSPPGESSPGDAEAVVFGVNDSETKAEMQRQRAIEENEKRLRRRLERLNITRNFQKSDGNCLFSALANQLFGNPRLHGLVRSLVIAYMRSNSADYRILFESDKEWNSYIERMRELGCWGDELCLNAASRCFGVNIHVITSDEARWHMIFQLDQLGDSVSFRKLANANTLAQPPEPSIGANTIALFLAYKAPLHYDDISPSPVPSVVLSDLLLPALQKRVAQQSSRSVPTPAAPSNSYKSAPHQQPPTGQPPPPANPPAARPSPQPSAAVTPPPNRMSSLPYRGPVGRSNSTTAVPPNPGTGLQQPGNQSPPRQRATRATSTVAVVVAAATLRPL